MKPQAPESPPPRLCARKGDLLLIFTRNLEDRQAKTRLQKVFGWEKTARIHRLLMEQTRRVTGSLTCAKAVFYSEYVPENGIFAGGVFEQHKQEGEDLGERMKNAFLWGFSRGWERIIVVGSDCYVLNESILRDAFHALKACDYALGPSQDGGFYLLGTRGRCDTSLFSDKDWGGPSVLERTLVAMREGGGSVHLTPPLYDIDRPEDWERLLGEHPMLADE